MASDAAPPLGAHPHDPLGAAERKERARSVSSDLQAIFGEARPAADAKSARRVARPVSGIREDTQPRRLSAASLGAIAAAALAGIAAGSLLVQRPHGPPAQPHPPALPVEMIAPPATPQASDAALAAPAEPIFTRPPPALPTVGAQASTEARPTRATSRSEVMTADRRLRAAYAAAIRAGVPRSVLAQDRDRWASARRRNADDPARLVASYRSIAGDLDHAAARGHRGGQHSSQRAPGRHSRFHPRFLPWWR